MQIILSCLFALLFFSTMKTCFRRNELADMQLLLCVLYYWFPFNSFFLLVLFIFEGLVLFRCLFECLLAEGVV